MNRPTLPPNFGSGGQYTGNFAGVGPGNFYQGGTSLSVPVEAWSTAAQTTNASTHFNFACVPLVPATDKYNPVPNPQLDKLGLFQHFGFIVHHDEVKTANTLKKRLRFAGEAPELMFGMKRQSPDDFGPMRSYMALESAATKYEDASVIMSAPAINYILALKTQSHGGGARDFPSVQEIVDLIVPVGVCVTVPRDLGYGKNDLDVRAFCLRGPADIHDVFGGNMGSRNDRPYNRIVKGLPLYYVLKLREVVKDEASLLVFNIGNGHDETIRSIGKTHRWAIEPWVPTDGTLRSPRLEEIQTKIDNKIYTGYYWKIGVVHEPPKKHDVNRPMVTPYNIGINDIEIANRCPLMSIFVDFVGPEMGRIIEPYLV